MNDQEKTREQLIAELLELRQRIADETAAPEVQAAAALFEVAPLGIHECDLEGRIRFVNPSQEAITGFTADELVGTYLWDRLAPGPERDALPAYFKHLIAEQPAPTPFFAKNIKKNDELFDVRVDWNYIRNPQGEVTGFVSIVTDITEGKRTETALRESEERFRRIFGEGPLGVVVASLDGRIQRVNRRFYDLLGYSEREIIELGIKGLSHPDDQQLDEQFAARLLRGEIPFYTVGKRLFRKDGQVIWGQLTVSLLRDAEGKPTHAIGMIEDITERKRAEEALARNKAILQAAIESLPFEFFAIGPDGRYILQNAILREHYGDAIGKRPDDYAPDEYTRQLWLDNNRRVFAGERIEGEIEAHIGGGTRHYYNVITPIQEDGEIRGILGVNVDITGRKRAENELQQANDRLEQRVLERTAELTKANESLQAEMAQRQQAEDALRQNEAKYRALVESSPDAVVMIDLQGRIVFASQRAAEQHGACHPEELLGTPAEDLVVEQERKRFRFGSRRLVEQGVRRNDQYTGLRRDGTTFAAELSSAIIRDAAGNPEGLMGVYRDVTDRKRAEEKLATLGRFVEAASQGFGMADLEGRITYVNPFLARMLGAESPAEVIGKPVSNYYPADYLSRREREIIPALRRREHWQGEQMLVFPDGQLHPTIHSIFPVHDDDGGLLCTASVITDITELRRAEQAVRQSEERYRTVLEDQTEVICRLKHDGSFIFVNEVYCRFFGKSKEELLGNKWQPVALPEDLPLIQERLRTLSPANPVVVIENRVHSGLGEVRWMQFVNRGFFDGGGRLAEIQAVGRDITERKQAEDKLKAEQRALRRMVLANDHERRLITYDLHDGVAQQLLGAMIYLQSQGLPKAWKSKAAETAYREGMEALRRAASEIRRVMNRLRTPVLDKYGLAEAIEDVAAQLRLPPDAPKIDYCHAVKFKRLEPTLENSLFRIAQEAMTNACRHSKSEKIHVELTQKGHDVTLEVRDWGIGFDQETVQENRFGLEGIRERCRILGGKLSIKSEPGKGTVVQVTFPVIEATDEVSTNADDTLGQ